MSKGCLASSSLLSSPGSLILTSRRKGVVSISSGAVVPRDCTLEGNISIGEGTVLHPRCKIIAENGSIAIGKGNIIEEHATIINSYSEVMRIGSYNLIETGARVSSRRVGDRNTIEIRAVLSEGTVVGNDCVVGVNVRIPPNEVLPDSVVVFGPLNTHRTLTDTKEAHLSMHVRHLQLLASTLPKFHPVQKPNVSTTPTSVRKNS